MDFRNDRLRVVELPELRAKTNNSFQYSITSTWYYLKYRVYLDVKTSEVFLCFVAIVRVRVYYVDFFVFFVSCHC